MDKLKNNTKLEVIRLILVDWIGFSVNYRFKNDNIVFYNTDTGIEHILCKSGLDKLELDNLYGYVFNIYHTLIDGSTKLSRVKK